jgi:hypothetical protein
LEAKFFRGNDFVRHQCVPKTTHFIGPTIGVVYMDIDHGDGSRTRIELKPTALVEITNQGDLPSSDDKAGSAHFANYGGLLERRFGIVPRRVANVKTGDKCQNEPTLAGNISATKLAKRFETRLPELAYALEHDPQCSEFTVDLAAGEHPACTNTDWP